MLHLAEKLIKKHEGLSLTMYRCPADKWTIGYGRNLEDRGISQDEADLMLQNDIALAVDDLRQLLPYFTHLSQARQAALTDMRFNLGPGGFRNFHRMIDAMARGDFFGASLEILDSQYADQVGARADTISRMIEEG